MKGFVKHLFVFSLALVLGCASALLHVAEAEEAYASVHGTTTPYTLVDTEGHAHHPGQSFVAIIPAERIAAVNQGDSPRRRWPSGWGAMPHSLVCSIVAANSWPFARSRFDTITRGIEPSCVRAGIIFIHSAKC